VRLSIMGFALLGCGDAVSAPKPPSGGRAFELSAPLFAASVAPVLSERGCDAGGDCHGGGIRGTFELSPASAKDLAFDFEQARLQVDPYDRARSPLLAKPLAEPYGGAPHAFEPFATADDPGYQAIRAWIEAGVFR
jgi:hypothetical protein